jgi:hypothetical protein
MTTRVVFPIKSSTACLLKWSWSSIFFQSGTSASCHRTQNYPIDPDNFSSFHNLPEKIQARNKMLSGEWPGAGCEYCKNIEEAGGESDRKFLLLLPYWKYGFVTLVTWPVFIVVPILVADGKMKIENTATFSKKKVRLTNIAHFLNRTIPIMKKWWPISGNI